MLSTRADQAQVALDELERRAGEDLGPETVVEIAPSSPWTQLTIAPGGLPERWAIWTRTGAVHRIDADGAAADEPDFTVGAQSSSLPTFEDTRAHAYRMLGDTADVLRSDWQPGHGPERDQATAVSEAFKHIGRAKDALNAAAP